MLAPNHSVSEAAGRVDELRGFRVGVTSDRRSGDLIAALERRGAQVLHAPALRIETNDQDLGLVAQTRVVIAAQPEVVLVTTGYGVRRWFEVADAAGLGAELTAVLKSALILARGPKAVGAVRAAGLDDVQTAELESTSALVDAVLEGGLTGRRVAIQLHGFTDEVQLARLAQVSAQVLTLTPYRWVQPSGDDRLSRLIEATVTRRLDALIFTSAPAAVATLRAADALGLGPAFRDKLTTDVLVAAVGPVTAAPLREAGAEVHTPDRYRLGALIRLVCEQLSSHHVERYRCGEVLVELRGRSVIVDGRCVALGPNARTILGILADSPSVVSRQQLISALPEPLDPHALEVAMSRLRRSLDVSGLISTVVRRGYKLNVVREVNEGPPKTAG